MSFIKQLLGRLAEMPAEEHAAAITEALSSGSVTPAEMSEEIGSLFQEMYGDGESVTSETVDQLEILGRVADGVDGVVQEHAARASRAQEIGQRIEGLQRDVSAEQEQKTQTPELDGKPEEPPAGAAGDAPEKPEKEEETPPDEPADPEKPEKDAPADDSDGAPEEEPPPGDEEEKKPPKKKTPPGPKSTESASADPAHELVATAVNSDRIPLGQTAPGTAPQQRGALPEAPRHSLVAAADVPGFSTGAEMEGGLSDFARAWEARMGPMVSANVNNGRNGERTRVGVARIRRDMPEAFTVQDERDAPEKIANACDETRLENGSLVASAGWCAPSETLYDLCPIRMTQEGLIDFPQIQTKRGGVRYPADFDWAAVWSSIGFELTEEEVIAGVEKRCVEVPCPSEWQECRMDVTGLCIRTPILMERGWPERVEQFMQGALLVHAHKQNARKLAKAEALSQRIVIPGPMPGANKGDPTIDPHGPGAVESLLSILELQVQYQRYRDRLSQTQTLEMIAPFWLRGILKSDLRKKLGIDNRWQITDAQLDGYFRAVGVRVQYVYDWQDAFEHPLNPSGFGGPIPLTWPDKVKLMLYPAGTFFELKDEVISLDGVYDHASLIQNTYTGLFMEEGWQVCKRCLDSYVIELDLCANGLSGTHMDVSCGPRHADEAPSVC